MSGALYFENFPGPEISIGAGSALIFSGYTIDPPTALMSLEVGFGNSWQKIRHLNERRDDLIASATSDRLTSLYVGFWGLFLFDKLDARQQYEFSYKAVYKNGYVQTGFICSSLVDDRDASENDKLTHKSPSQPLVAICLASYNPNYDYFQAQIESLLNQTLENWSCIICDDASNHETIDFLHNICRLDTRLELRCHDNNLGFYKNFERALTYVPANASYIALCDQDDVWSADKLECLINSFTTDTSLVYSDMRLIDSTGQILSNSYWTSRKNNYTNLHVLLSANSITGAASIFRTDLLKKILPFPDRISDAYHDHWIALVAFLSGPIKYLPKPLYDYRQHDRNIIGHTPFKRAHLRRFSIKSLAKSTWGKVKLDLVKSGVTYTSAQTTSSNRGKFVITVRGRVQFLYATVTALGRVVSNQVIQTVKKYRQFFVDIYKNQYRALDLFSATLLLRFKNNLQNNRTERQLQAYSGRLRDCVFLGRNWLNAKFVKKTTGNRDLYMAIGICLYRLDPVAKFHQMRIGRKSSDFGHQHDHE